MKNLDTGTVETFEIHGNAFNSTCAAQTFNLVNNYNSRNVELKFDIGNLSTGTFQIDNVVSWSWS